MEITLEKIELVKDRTGVSYKEAKEALEAADGSVVDAIISIEEKIDSRSTGTSSGANSVVESIKEIVKKGNVSKIVIKNSEGDVLLNVPVTVGVLGVVVAPWGAIAGVIAAFGFKCIIEVVKEDGTIIDVSDKTTDVVGKATEKGSEVYDKVKNSETYEKVKDKTGETISKASEAIKNKIKKDKKDDDEFDDYEFKDYAEREGEEE